MLNPQKETQNTMDGIALIEVASTPAHTVSQLPAEVRVVARIENN